MRGVEWLFPVLLLLAFVISAILTLLQQRRYTREINAAAQASTGPHDVLVTGRGRGVSRGAIVIFVVDRSEGCITRASAMVGSTVFARFRAFPTLLGPTAGAQERANGKHLKKAVAAALAQVPANPTAALAERKRSERERADRARRARAATRSNRKGRGEDLAADAVDPTTSPLEPRTPRPERSAHVGTP
ncbi:transcriptional regulator GutM [Dermabacter jinjuensis]|uniref:Glucitol operon activator protein (GutM) n=1 Tax=Dermabacter jinjuensis TaxID=1667168 RepID=A0ABN5DPZ5_9MICO|nr:transcriptional regulator GutM [Dermabacter jinjuensis]ATH97331.1 hypothetical protein COP05_09775 [Dermabacter jinjuensis]UEB89518.1 transcriptional regulator GutM [Dermabacter jinjuensis]